MNRVTLGLSPFRLPDMDSKESPESADSSIVYTIDGNEPGTKSGTIGAQETELCRLIAAWPKLSNEVRCAIMRLVDKAASSSSSVN